MNNAPSRPEARQPKLRTRRSFHAHLRSLLLPVFVLALLSADGASLYGEPNDAAPPLRLPEFMISHWGFPKDEKQLELFAEAGFNTVIAVPEELPVCRQYGWRALLAVSEDQAAEYVEDPIVWGYHLFDEPARKGVKYDSFVKKMAAFHRLDPHRPAYINLNEEDDPRAFTKLLEPRVLSYDYYQWWSGREPFFPLLEKFRAAALEANIPLLCWVEAVAVPSGPIPADNEARIRHSVYSALAYGAQGIQWWAWRPYNQDAARINAELANLGPVLMSLRSVDVFHTRPLPKTTRELSPESWVQSPTRDLVLGFFKNENRGDFLLVANRNWQEQQTAALTIRRPTSGVELFDRKTGKWKNFALIRKGDDQGLSLNVAPGDGELLRVMTKPDGL